MRHRKRSGTGVILLLLLSTLILGGTWLYTTWRSSEAVLPATIMINGLRVAGMTRDQALVAIEQAYTIPITVTYAGQVISPLLPETVELRVDIQATAQNLDEAIASQSGGLAFVQYLIDTVRSSEPPKTNVPAVVLYSRERVDAFLQRTAQKYDHPPLGPVALPESGTFRPAAEGTTLNREASLPLLISAILSPDPAKREVALVVATEPAPEVSLDVLKQALTAALAGFRGVVSIYAKDLEGGSELCLQCDVAHTGIGAIEVATALEIYRTREIPLDNDTAEMMDAMLTMGDSAATDGLLSALGAGDAYSGAQQVTDGLWSLGLRNTFVTAPLSVGGQDVQEASIATPANTRTDVTTQPWPDRPNDGSRHRHPRREPLSLHTGRGHAPRPLPTGDHACGVRGAPGSNAAEQRAPTALWCGSGKHTRRPQPRHRGKHLRRGRACLWPGKAVRAGCAYVPAGVAVARGERAHLLTDRDADPSLLQRGARRPYRGRPALRD